MKLEQGRSRVFDGELRKATGEKAGAVSSPGLPGHTSLLDMKLVLAAAPLSLNRGRATTER